MTANLYKQFERITDMLESLSKSLQRLINNQINTNNILKKNNKMLKELLKRGG